MVININPSRINVQTGATGKASDRRRQLAEDQGSDAPLITPKRAIVNIIPSPESLSTLIRSAIEAMRKGKFWDRGTIVNLVV